MPDLTPAQQDLLNEMKAVVSNRIANLEDDLFGMMDEARKLGIDPIVVGLAML